MTATVAQHLEALEIANRSRSHRARVKRAMRERSRSAAAAIAFDVVAVPREGELNWRVANLLDAIPRVGPRGVARIMRRAVVPDGKTVGGLSDRQRRAILDELRAMAEDRPDSPTGGTR